MPLNRSIDNDHKPLSNPDRQGNGAASGDIAPLSRSQTFSTNEPEPSFGMSNPTRVTVAESQSAPEPTTFSFVNENEATHVNNAHKEAEKKASTVKQEKREQKDFELLNSDRWLVRNGHFMTFVALYLFSVMVLFRPYEIVPGLGFLSATAFYFAMVTLACYFPSQLAVEGNLTMMSTEVKALLGLTLISIVTMPIAKDPGFAWETFNDSYSKSVIIFIVLVNVVRTRKRLMSMMWLSFGIGIYLSFAALDLYMKGQFDVEDYRVAVNVGGMFGNPNEMAMHFVMMTPLMIVLGIAAEKKLVKLLYFGCAFLLIAANMVTFSRGGFLGLMAVGFVLAWKLGRRHRLNVSVASIVIGAIVILAAPGNYGLRMLSIFIPGLDPVGSSDQRKELLERSILVTLRNPWGIGIGNFPIVGVRNLQTHNAFTQVSAELGILGLIAYLIFMLSPFRKLSAIERKHFNEDRIDWYYYLAIGLQASIIGYMVSSFFASVAYNWFIYYLIAYAVAFRRIYSVEKETVEVSGQTPLVEQTN
jgi:O-antigen ligase